MDFSDFEEIDSVAEFGRDDQYDDEALTFSPLHAGVQGHPPWQGHGAELIGVVDMGR